MQHFSRSRRRLVATSFVVALRGQSQQVLGECGVGSAYIGDGGVCEQCIPGMCKQILADMAVARVLPDEASYATLLKGAIAAGDLDAGLRWLGLLEG